MEQKILMNQLLLSYSPLCNRDFTILKTDPVIQNIIETSSLYIIAQRPEMRFDNILNNEEEKAMEFDIKQINNPNVLKCKVPLFQENIATDPSKEVLIYLGSNDENNDFKTFKSNVHGMKFYQEEILDENFLIWFSPEKFLQNYWKGHLVAEIEGNINDFTKYKVHYVGQSTKQDIWKRLTGHEKLQDILSLEYPLSYGSLPTHEIAILLFRFYDNIFMHTYGDESIEEDVVDSMLGKNMPDQRTIFLDAEKALISSMQPKYNDELFKNYPKSTDGLYKHNYDSVSYSFMDPISLVYDKGEIEGGLSALGGDTIVIKKNKKIELFKYPK
ncbi:MAG: hypothetical protein A3F72_14105 [Bacteroidetes bacterium RIFCSPLOWO2_12_FULL_35_15]|nr:MAG: hypothetical protein A3F72_14105 [Bacteroidetes bacterium RIFCSPLOWO2_12_FULL_35_15]